MTTHNPTARFADAIVHAEPPLPAARGEYGRAFDLPPALHLMTVGIFLAYLAVLGTAFMTREMVVPIAICAVIVIASFLTPGLWVRVAGPTRGRKQNMADFMRDGFECMTGHVSGRAAVAQVLILPVLIFGWGVAIAIIAASVR
jgi:hypothetical protein